MLAALFPKEEMLLTLPAAEHIVDLHQLVTHAGRSIQIEVIS